jgi:hypothetical protein
MIGHNQACQKIEHIRFCSSKKYEKYYAHINGFVLLFNVEKNAKEFLCKGIN